MEQSTNSYVGDDHTSQMNATNKLSLEEELNNLRSAFQSLQELNEALQHENENLKVKLQNQENVMNENDTSVATAAVRTLGVFVMRSVLRSLLVSDPYNDLTADLTCHGKSVFTF